MIDGFAISPYAASRFKTRLCDIPPCTPHSSFFARLASGAFYEPVSYAINFELTNKRSAVASAPEAVIPAKAGINVGLGMDARLTTSGMTDAAGHDADIFFERLP
jgi:hypothetical protein